MNFSKVHSAQAVSIKTTIITVETDISKGFHSFSIVGLPTKAVEEAQDRISAAIKNTGFVSPKQKNQKVVISLAPASLKKEGTFFDLAMALGYLKSIRAIDFDEDESIFLGELSLNGELKSLKGVLPITQEAVTKGFKKIFLPLLNAKEAAFVKGIEVYGAKTLFEVITHINKKDDVEFNPPKSIALHPTTPLIYKRNRYKSILSDIRGQETAKRALEIAVAGRHNIALYGPPGTGKTLLAKALASILPPLSEKQVFETTSLHSFTGNLPEETLITEAPFRSPHHTSSPAAIIGGGTFPVPGEITLSHNGVLFLDEFPEFDRRIIESLREPLEEGEIIISRAREKVIFPANFILVVAFNPCPCGYFGSEKNTCSCTAYEINKYKKKVSGPIIDRIDLWCTADTIPHKELSTKITYEDNTEEIRNRIKKARLRQRKRFKNKDDDFLNKDMSNRNINKLSLLSEKAENILITFSEKMMVSARTYHKVIKVSRTIADLDDSEEIKEHHILEALQYRPIDKILS